MIKEAADAAQRCGIPAFPLDEPIDIPAICRTELA
jgi:hypothetical protein